MCTKPIRIKNNSKYLNNKYGQPYYIWVNCGHCAECIKAKQTEWTLRTYYQCQDTLSKGGYMYFDTLTYRNEDLPRITNYIEANKNYACFNYRDIRNFYENLRQQLKLKKDNLIKYFITSEYGDIRHRPHYHIILFIYDNTIDPFELSKQVSKAWTKGRTDGLPYKSKQYVKNHNIIKTINLNCIRYVAKYVNKSQTFTKIINERWTKLENYYNKTKFDKLKLKKIKQQYFRLTTPFHRQSQGFGITAIQGRSIEDIINNPILFYKTDDLTITKKCQLPMYFYRKLFQKQIKFNGKRIWINTEDGIKYKEFNEKQIIEKTTDKIKDQAINNNITIDNELATKIAIYILFERGRMNGKHDYKAHHTEAEFYNYSTNRDLKFLGKKCISKQFAGNDTIGYQTTEIEQIDITPYIYINEEYEAIINTIQHEKDTTNLILLHEHLNEIKKVFFQ